MIFACYAGTGKTTAAFMRSDTLDLLLAPFKYGLIPAENVTYEEHEALKATEHDYFDLQYPVKYVDAMRGQMDYYDYILIPTDPNVLNRLDELDIFYLTILPDYSKPKMKKIYEERYIRRGNNKRFLSIFIERWDCWMKCLSTSKNPFITLSENEYVSDILERLF